MILNKIILDSKAKSFIVYFKKSRNTLSLQLSKVGKQLWRSYHKRGKMKRQYKMNLF